MFTKRLIRIKRFIRKKLGLEALSSSVEELRKKNSELEKKIQDLKENITMGSNFSKQLFESVYGSDLWLSSSRNKFKGKRCFLLGNGPSLNDINLDLLKNEYTMGVNGICLSSKIKVNFLVIVAYEWWKSFVRELEEYECDRIFMADYVKIKPRSSYSELSTVKHSNYKQFSNEIPYSYSKRPDQFVYIGGTVLNVGIQILDYLGFDEIYLIGVDHNYKVPRDQVPKVGGGMFDKENFPHFIEGYNPSENQVHVDYYAMERGFELSKRYFESSGKRIYNATPRSKLEIFEKVDFNSLFS